MRAIIQLAVLQEKLTRKSYLRVSKRRVPHLVIEGKEFDYSVAYFESTKMFKIFFPFPSFEEVQRKITCKGVETVIAFFEVANDNIGS